MLFVGNNQGSRPLQKRDRAGCRILYCTEGITGSVKDFIGASVCARLWLETPTRFTLPLCKSGSVLASIFRRRGDYGSSRYHRVHAQAPKAGLKHIADRLRNCLSAICGVNLVDKIMFSRGTDGLMLPAQSRNSPYHILLRIPEIEALSHGRSEHFCHLSTER